MPLPSLTLCCYQLWIGFLLQMVTVGRALNDDRWHNLHIKHRGRMFELTVDNSLKSKVDLGEKHRTLSFTQIDLGNKPQEVNGNHSRRLMRNANKNREPEQNTERPNGFVGKMQQLIVNRNEMFEMMKTGAVKRVDVTAVAEKNNGGLNFPITFRSPEAYILTKVKIYSTFKIYLQLKTTQSNGLILYSGQVGKDFLALELVAGHIRYSYDVGSSPRMVHVNLRHGINDNRWHDVTINHPTLTEHRLRVDNVTRVDILPDASSVHFDTGGDLYIGGVPKAFYSILTKQVKSREGFQGCMASIDLNEDSRVDGRSILEHAAEIPQEYRDQVKDGCEGPASKCSDTSCDHGGLCVQEWNSYTCNCDLTSFTGQTCTDDGVAYTFGGREGRGGLITFKFDENERTDTRQDALAFGFRTTQSDGVLVRVTSGNSNDYIELELMDGNMFAVYNMGMMDHPIGELFEKVNNGNYHVVRFIRNGPNSTLQVDNFPVLSKYPTGRQLTTFNHLGQVYIGGMKDTMGKLVSLFHGSIAGLVLNGLHLLELAAYNDSRIKIEDDVELETKPLRPNQR